MRKTLIGAACLSLQPLALNALSVPVLAYIIFRLGPTGYGQWTVATALLTVFAILSSLGLRGAFVRSVAADPESAASFVAEQLGLRMFLTTVAGLLALLVCRLLDYPAPVLWCALVGAAGLLLSSVATTLADLLQAFHRLKTLASVNLVSGLSLIAVSVAAARWGDGPVAMAAAYLTGPVVSALLLIVIVQKRCFPVRVRWNVRRFVKLVAGSRFFAAQLWLATGSAHAEALLLPRLVGMHQFGFFTAGTLLATRLTALPDGLCMAAYPAMIKVCSGEEGPKGGASLVAKLLLIAASGGVLIAFVGMLCADAIGGLLFPGQSEVFAVIASITIWSLPIGAVESVMGSALNAAGKDAAQARASLPAAVLSLVGTVVLVFSLGVTGACWSMLLRPAVRAAFLAPLVFRTFWRDVAPGVRSEDVAPALPVLLRKAG